MAISKKVIKRRELELECFLNKPSTILWSVIEELRDIHEWYLPNLFTFIKYGKKARKHLARQIDRLEIILKALEDSDEISKF